MFKKIIAVGLTLTALALSGCDKTSSENTKTAPPPVSDLSLNIEKYTLENGLEVVLHVDRSDPVVAINIAAHVGSAREVAGRTGFAHLFEHLLFLDSENLGYGGLDEMNTRIGGEGTNGFTTHDMTQYFQAVPKDALEKVVWAEADKLGWFIETVTQDVIDNEKQVVKNEKRQRVDNQPYGHGRYIVNKALYPTDHPYNWQVIGSLEDLDAATLDDVKQFYSRWYVPNNVTVTLTGDFDVAEAKQLIEKYFGEIPRGEDITPYVPTPSPLAQTKKLYYEDNFATVPQLMMVWPTVEQYHPDSYALAILVDYLTDGKRAPFNEVLVDEAKVTSDVSGYHYTKEISGELYLIINPNEGEDIDGLMPAINTAFSRFEKHGMSQSDLDQIKAGIEVNFYGNIQSALGKAIQLAEYNLFADDPNFYLTDIKNVKAVTTDDVMRVYETYIKDQPLLYLSIVPSGQVDLNLESSIRADIVEEIVVEGEGAPVDFDPAARIIANPTPSSFDRSAEPAFGEPYTLPTPSVWMTELANDVKVFGIESRETPLVYFSLYIDAGNNRATYDKPAVPDMTAALLEKGTAQRTPSELEDAIRSLGSDISISAGQFGTTIRGETLSRNFNATLKLVEEMLLEPRWDAVELETLKRSILSEIDLSAGNPNAIASREMSKIRYPEGHIFHYAGYGPKAKVEAVTLDDLKAFYNARYTQHNAMFRVAGAVDAAQVETAMSGISQSWSRPAPENAIITGPIPVNSATLYMYDVPGAKQSVIRMERPAMTIRDTDYPLANAMNFLLGGIYTSKLNTELRVNRGYTYGIRSGFSASKDRGNFNIRTSVRTNVTKESLDLIRTILANYGPDFTQNDLTVMKAALLRGQALKSETLSDKLSIVNAISLYDFPNNYRALNAERIEAMQLEDFKALAAAHLRPDAMNYLVVGDAETQAAKLSDLGIGEPVMIARDSD